MFLFPFLGPIFLPSKKKITLRLRFNTIMCISVYAGIKAIYMVRDDDDFFILSHFRLGRHISRIWGDTKWSKMEIEIMSNNRFFSASLKLGVKEC